jgi:hypothetical protein
MGIQERAAQLSRYLVVNKTEGERQDIIVKAADAPEWVENLVYAVHGDNLPDDFTYETIREAADAIEDMGEDAELEADIYTRDLLTWLTEYPDAAHYCDTAAEEWGITDMGIIERIRIGQSYAKREILAAVLSELEALDLDDEDDTAEYDTPIAAYGGN